MGLKKFMKKKALPEGQTSGTQPLDVRAPTPPLANPTLAEKVTPPRDHQATSPPAYVPMIICSQGSEDEGALQAGAEGGQSRPPATLALTGPHVASKRLREEAGGDGFLSLSAGGHTDTIIHLMKKMSLPGDEEVYAGMAARDRYRELVLCTSKVSFLAFSCFADFSSLFIRLVSSFVFLVSFSP